MPSVIKTNKNNPIVLSSEEFEYYKKALSFAIKRGFKIKLFDTNGKLKALQG